MSGRFINTERLEEKIIHYDSGKLTSETQYRYSVTGKLIKEKTLENGDTNHTYEYNEDENKVVKECIYFGGDLYEEVRFFYCLIIFF
ncbi:MAG: hypothetical protein HRT68_02470 [Flavobacteriaceae bacterium]|nr:hypothetical protein [Flavobacteriaceae bacterium]